MPWEANAFPYPPIEANQNESPLIGFPNYSGSIIGRYEDPLGTCNLRPLIDQFFVAQLESERARLPM